MDRRLLVETVRDSTCILEKTRLLRCAIFDNEVPREVTVKGCHDRSSRINEKIIIFVFGQKFLL